jgi:hypothetical protein
MSIATQDYTPVLCGIKEKDQRKTRRGQAAKRVICAHEMCRMPHGLCGVQEGGNTGSAKIK